MDPVNDIPGLMALWQKASGGDPAVHIAIIDGPVDVAHPALIASRITLVKAVTTAPPAAIKSEHGTHVASVLMGVPSSPVWGVAPSCTATIFSIYGETVDGDIEPSSQATLALAINQAIAAGADIITISSGQKSATGQADHVLADAVRQCADAGKLIVAAAGNDGCRCVQVPGALDSVLAVGACNLAGEPLPFSNFGDAYLDNGILAPGENVKGASPAEQVALRSGTSFATPIVAGVIALLMSCLRQSGRDADPRAVRQALLDTAKPCDPATVDTARQCLAGRLDIAAATDVLLGDKSFQTDRVAPLQARSEPVGSISSTGRTAGEGQPFTNPPPAIKEGLMGDTPMTDAISTPLILSPDGSAMRSDAGLTPSQEALSAPPPAHSGSESSVDAAAVPSGVATPPAGPLANAAPLGGGGHYMWMPDAVIPNTVQPPAAPSALAVGPLEMQPQACEGGCGIRPSQAMETGQMAFPIGQLYYDFGKEARLDYFVQAIANWRDSLAGRGEPEFGPDRDRSGDSAAPYNPETMVRYLLNLALGEGRRPDNVNPNFPDADAITWTLTIDRIPIYAIKPLQVFGLGFYASLMLALWHQEVSPIGPNEATDTDTKPDSSVTAAGDAFPPQGSVTRVSLAGWVDQSNTTRLLNGTVVPTLTTDWRGFYSWNLDTLLGADRSSWPEGAEGFLQRLYNEFRNVGLSPQDRALNYSAMNAHNTRKIFTSVLSTGKRLDTVETDRSVICRPESDCWDVTFRFFDPKEVLTQARDVYQYTIDVSDVVPVAVGPLRQWQVY